MKKTKTYFIILTVLIIACITLKINGKVKQLNLYQKIPKSEEALPSPLLDEYRMALYETALAYYEKGTNVQYDDRRKFGYFPEDATEDNIQYSTCVDFAAMVYKNALGLDIPMNGSLYDVFVEDDECDEYVIKNYKGENYIENVVVKDETSGKYVYTDLGKNVLDSLKIGDIVTITYEKDKGGGHTMLVLDFIYDTSGNRIDAKLIHSYGAGLDKAGSTEKLERDNIDSMPYAEGIGAIIVTPMSDQFGTRYTNSGKLYVIRPLALIDNNNENIFKSVGNARSEYLGSNYEDTHNLRGIRSYQLRDEIVNITESAKFRLKYSGINISKIGSKHTGSSIKKGDEITYTITIKNDSNDEIRRFNRNVSYNGIIINENVPDSTEIKEISNSGTITTDESGKKIITWKVESLEPGEIKKLTYSIIVNETSNIGDTIEATGYVTYLKEDNTEGEKIQNSTVINKVTNKFTESEENVLINEIDNAMSDNALSGIQKVNTIYKNFINDEKLLNDELTVKNIISIARESTPAGAVLGANAKLYPIARYNTKIDIINKDLKPTIFKIEGSSKYMNYGIKAKTKADDTYSPINTAGTYKTKYCGGDIKNKTTGETIATAEQIEAEYLKNSDKYNIGYDFLSNVSTHDNSAYQYKTSIQKGNINVGDIILTESVTNVRFKKEDGKFENRELDKKQYVYIYGRNKIILLGYTEFEYEFEKDGKSHKYNKNDNEDYVTSIINTTTKQYNTATVVCEDKSNSEYYMSKEMYDIKNELNIFLASLILKDYFVILSPAMAMPASVDITGETHSIRVGDETKLQASYYPETATMGTDITWTSSNEEVASVDENGKVTGLKAGTTTITAKTENGRENTFEITILNKNHKVIWKNEDGTILEIDSEVEHGTKPEYNGKTPEKVEDIEYIYTFEGWTPTIEDTTKVTEDITYTAMYEATKQKYTATFILNNGEKNVTKIQEWGTKLEAPSNISKEGYTFDGWDEEVLNEMPLQDVTYTAKWKVVNYGITYELNGGTNSENNPATYTIEDIINLVDALKTGYTFQGWYEDTSFTGNKITKIENETGNITLYAKFTAINYNITYNLNEGSMPQGKSNPGSYTIETENITLNNPIKEGYEFKGWTGSSGNVPELTVTIEKGSTGNKEYTANWEAIPTPIKLAVDTGKYDVKEDNKTGIKYLTKIKPNTKIKDIIDEEIDTNGTIEIYNREEKIDYLTKDKLAGTGNKIVITLNEERIEYIIVVTGDLNGDGTIGQGDLLMLAKYNVGKLKEDSKDESQRITRESVLASDLNEDGTHAGQGDLLKMAKILVE